MAGPGGRQNGTMSQLVVARGWWLMVEDHLEEIFYPRDITHKMVGNMTNLVLSFIFFFIPPPPPMSLDAYM